MDLWKTDGAAYRRAKRAAKRALGLCITQGCAAPPVQGQQRCEACRIVHNARGRAATARRDIARAWGVAGT